MLVQKVSIILVLPRFWNRQVDRRETIPAGACADTGMFWEPVWAFWRKVTFWGPAGGPAIPAGMPVDTGMFWEPVWAF